MGKQALLKLGKRNFRFELVNRIEKEYADMGYPGDEARASAVADVMHYEEVTGMLINGLPLDTNIPVLAALVMCKVGGLRSEDEQWQD